MYRPYRQKRKTRASVAKERGLEPLAQWLLSQPRQGDPLTGSGAIISMRRKALPTAEEALQGAMDIIAEQIADDAKIRAWVRRYTFDQRRAADRSEGCRSKRSVYEMYYDYQEPFEAAAAPDSGD